MSSAAISVGVSSFTSNRIRPTLASADLRSTRQALRAQLSATRLFSPRERQDLPRDQDLGPGWTSWQAFGERRRWNRRRRGCRQRAVDRQRHHHLLIVQSHHDFGRSRLLPCSEDSARKRALWRGERDGGIGANVLRFASVAVFQVSDNPRLSARVEGMDGFGGQWRSGFACFCREDYVGRGLDTRADAVATGRSRPAVATPPVVTRVKFPASRVVDTKMSEPEKTVAENRDTAIRHIPWGAVVGGYSVVVVGERVNRDGDVFRFRAELQRIWVTAREFILTDVDMA